MDELKLLEKLLHQRDKGELQDYQGQDVESEQALALEATTSADGIVQAWLDEFRWKKTDELVGQVWDPEQRSTFASMSQRCAVQVLLERKGENFVRKLFQDRQAEQRDRADWLRAQGLSEEEVEGQGISGGIRGLDPRQKAPLKDAQGVGGVRKESQAFEHGQARSQDLQAVRHESMVSGTTQGAYGHMETWITDRAKAQEKDGRFVVKLDHLDLHTQVYVRSRNDSAWSEIEDFEDFYGGAHDTSFATHDGVVLHENQHVQERTDIFNKHLPWFRDQVARIEAESEEEALERYQELYDEFEEKVDREYFEVGEVPARALEWEYYHSAYEAATGATGASAASARAAGASQGKKETEKQQASLTMSAEASERSAVPLRGRDLGGGLPANLTLSPGRTLPRSLTLPSGPGGRVDGGRAAGAGEPREPKLLALVQDKAASAAPGGVALRFVGTRPVFGIGQRSQVAGAKAGVAVAQDSPWAAGPADIALDLGTKAPAAGAVDWLLHWWRRGGEEPKGSKGGGEQS